MKRIENYIGSAPKTRKGSLEYGLWIDESGVLFIKILRNLNEKGKPATGTYTKLLLRVSEYLDERHTKGKYASIKGINPETFKIEKASVNNNSNFIKAIIRQLFPKNS